MTKVKVLDHEITTVQYNDEDYISLTDIKFCYKIVKCYREVSEK